MFFRVISVSCLLYSFLNQIGKPLNQSPLFLDLLNCYEMKAAPGENTDPNFIIYPSYPGNPGNYSNDFNMYNYFNNLYEYFPCNKSGTCAYVSMAMALQYLDTFYDDDIIPEQYEVFTSVNSSNVNATSPGTRYDSSIFPYSQSPNQSTFFNSTYNECFDSKLVVDYTDAFNLNYGLSWHDQFRFINSCYSSLNVITGICDDPLDPNYNVPTHTFAKQDVLDQMVNIFDADEYLEVAKSVSSEMFDDIVEVIDDGFPVLLSICQGFTQHIINDHTVVYDNYGDHSVVCYDYEIIDDEIVLYCNFGYGYGTTHLPFDDGPFEIAYAFIPMMYSGSTHHHSDNYVVNGSRYCGCGHHTHTLQYSYVDRFKHSMICPCGYLQHENHSDPFNYSCCTDNLPPTPGVL